LETFRGKNYIYHDTIILCATVLCSNTDSDSVIPLESGIEESLGSSSTRNCQQSCQQTDDATEFERMIEFQQSPLDILLETFMDKLLPFINFWVKTMTKCISV